MIAAITGGWLVGLILLPALVVLAVIIGVMVGAVAENATVGIVSFALSWVLLMGFWWWGSAFTTSSDYHAWNPKQGEVEKLSKRLVSSGSDGGMYERYVLVIDGKPYGVDDTRASLVKEGDYVKLLCKKDYQFGVPREVHGWACRWNMPVK